MKTCSACKIEKPLSDFRKIGGSGKNKDYLRSSCRICVNLKASEWRSKNPARVRENSLRYFANNKDGINEQRRQRHKANPLRFRAEQLRIKYGVTLEWYAERLKEQNYCCAICGVHESAVQKKLAVDHNHDTGENRGLLCHLCNRALERFDNVVGFASKAAQYLFKGDSCQHQV